MTGYTRDPTQVGFFAPMRFEADLSDCEVIGKIPTDLNGAFVRVGGEWLYRPLRNPKRTTVCSFRLDRRQLDVGELGAGRQLARRGGRIRR